GKLGLAEGFGYPLAQVVWDRFAAVLTYDHTEFRLEVERLAAGGAVVEVLTDQDTPLRRQLSVEVVVQQVDRFDAVALVLSHTPSLCGSPLWLGDEATLPAKLVQPLLQRPSSAMEPAHDGADRNIENLGDLLVGEAFHVAEQNGDSELLGQCVERLFDLALGEVLEHLLLGALAGGGPLQPAQASIQVEVLDILDVAFLGPALLGAVGVDERVGEDPVQPGLEVGALLEPAEAAVGLQVGRLHEVFGVGRVA